MCDTLQGKYEEAGSLFERSLAIREKGLGPEHLSVALSLGNWANSLQCLVRTIIILPTSSERSAVVGTIFCSWWPLLNSARCS